MLLLLLLDILHNINSCSLALHQGQVLHRYRISAHLFGPEDDAGERWCVHGIGEALGLKAEPYASSSSSDSGISSSSSSSVGYVLRTCLVLKHDGEGFNAEPSIDGAAA
jgi:hypothetical protein